MAIGSALVAALLFGDSGSAAAAAGDELLERHSPDLRQHLHADGMVVKVSARDPNTAESEPSSVVLGFVLFDPPPERVYRFLSQTERQIEYRSELTGLKTLKWESAGPLDRHRIRILFQHYEYHLAYTLDPTTHSMSWELDDRYDNDLLKASGSWELHAMEDGRTLGRFTTSVDVSGGLPRMLQDFFTAHTLPSTLGNCRHWVNSGGTFRP